jgi:hypothetical protein
MKPFRPNPPARQLRLALDSAKLRGMSPSERSKALVLLAQLLLEAASAATGEHADDRV